MPLAECKHTLVHPLYLCVHIYRVAIVRSIIWVLDGKTAGFVPPGETAQIRSVYQHDPVLRIAFTDLVEMVGPFVALEYACARGMDEWSIQIFAAKVNAKLPACAKVGTLVAGESMVHILSVWVTVSDVEARQCLDVLRDAAPTAAGRANEKNSFGQGYFSHRYISPGIMIANCGRKFKMMARSFHFQPT